MKLKVRNKRIDDDQLMKMRRAELDRWPTGKAIDFDEVVAFQKSLPDSKIWWKVMAKLREEGRMSVFPRAGTPILEDMIELCRGLRESGVVLIPVTADSYTRLGEYDKAVEDFTRAIQLYSNTSPACVSTRFHLAKAYAKLNQTTEAIEQLEQFLDLHNRVGGLEPADVDEARRLLKQLQEGR